MASLEFLSVSKSYGANCRVIQDVSLSVAQGEFCVFVGPSGCGKSTLLRMLAGLEEISEGELRIDGKRMNHVPPAQRGGGHGIPELRLVSPSHGIRQHRVRVVGHGYSQGQRLAFTVPPEAALHLFDEQGYAVPRTVDLPG